MAAASAGDPTPDPAGVPDMQATMLRMMDSITKFQNQMGTLHSEGLLHYSHALQSDREKMHGMHSEMNKLQRQAGEGGPLHSERREREDDLVDKKLFLPEPCTGTSIFRKWKLEFEDYIAGRHKTLSHLLEKSEQGGDRGRWRQRESDRPGAEALPHHPEA